MPLEIEKAETTGFCFGVKRTIETLKKVAREQGELQVLGAIVHNREVEQELADFGVKVVDSLENMKGQIIAIGAHGVTPQIEAELRDRHDTIINTTCPFVHRAQLAARKLAKAGFMVVVYGDKDHAEVKGILGWAEGKGIATLDDNFATNQADLPRRIGILSQTTQVPERFTGFVKNVIDKALMSDTELRIIDTICHDTKKRQQSTIELAQRVDLMLVIGSPTSANTRHLAELCGTLTQTRMVETAGDIKPAFLKGHRKIGVAGGASTSEQTIDEVVARLKAN